MKNEQIKKPLFRKFRRKTVADLMPQPEINASTPIQTLTTSMQVLAFDKHELIDKTIESIEEIQDYLGKHTVTWLKVTGLHESSKIDAIASFFKLHQLAMEDVINIYQRPKIEEYDDLTFAITRTPIIKNNELDLEQVSLFWGENFIISFNESNNCDYFAPLKIRLRNDKKRQHMLKPEYIAYAIIDVIIDSFFPILESYGSKIDVVEENAVANPSSQIIVNIHGYKHDLSIIRHAMWSQRDAIRRLVETTKDDDKDLRFFIRDCEDHTIQIIDILENYRERTSGLMDIYLSSVNNKMNEVMKVLTMISTIFMPTSLIASIYGMNFDRTSAWNMPELGWKYGYQFALLLMLSVAVSFLFYFKRKGWISFKLKKKRIKK
jgi:magnesium transporter